jgi:transcriptional regulator with XRE-family HTH domain
MIRFMLTEGIHLRRLRNTHAESIVFRYSGHRGEPRVDEPTGETLRIVRELKRMLKARGITYAQLGKLIGLSEASVKRVFSRSTLTLQRVEAICKAAGTSVLDVTKLASAADDTAPDTLTWDQEAELAADPGLLGCFYLLINGRKPAELADDLATSERQVRRWLAQLNRLGLVKVLPGNRTRIRTAPAIAWRKDGPVRALYEEQVRKEFLRSPFSGGGEALHFRSAELSEASSQILLKKLARLAAEFRELAELDRLLPRRDKRSFAVLIACRPWVFSMFEGFKHGGSAGA